MATRALMSTRRFLQGCPRPLGSAPPPAPPSAPVGTYTTFSDAAGTARNGPSRFAGFRVTAQTTPGPVRAYNGPQVAGYPLVLEVLSPILNEWYYSEVTTDPADPATWRKSQYTWATIGGTGQVVEWAFNDFLGSPYAEMTQALELARITSRYVGTTYYWKAKDGGAAGSGTVGSPWNGAVALKNGLAAGVADWSIVQFDYVNGPCTIATDGADWPSATAIGTAFSSGSAASSGANPSGIIFGTNLINTSTAARIWFKFDSTQLAVDWSGATNINRRAWGAIRFQGEEMCITGLKIKGPNWSPLIDPVTKATRIAGSGASPDAVGNSQADQKSFENHGIMVFGNGNHVHNCISEGDYSWGRYGFCVAVAEEGVSGAAPNLRGSVSFCQSSKMVEGYKIQQFGASGYDLEVPTGMDFHHNIASDPGFGRNATYLPTGPGNALSHGNCVGMQGKWFGGLLCYNNDLSGDWQDGFAGVSAGTVCYDNYIHQLGTGLANITEWYWTGAAWDTRTHTNTEGNAIKTGLSNKDWKSPTTWCGADGSPMTDAVKGDTDHLGVAEVRWIVCRNVVDQCNGNGLTTNESNGVFIAYNEFYDPKGQGILFHGANKTAAQIRPLCNMYIMNNFIQKVSLGAGSACIRLEQRTNNSKKVWLYNNILWCNNPTHPQYELFVESGVTFVDARKNVLVKARVSGTYSTANDLTDGGSIAAAQLYVRSVGGVRTGCGLPGGSPLLGAGYSPAITASRTFGCFTNLKGEAITVATPNVGPV